MSEMMRHRGSKILLIDRKNLNRLLLAILGLFKESHYWRSWERFIRLNTSRCAFAMITVALAFLQDVWCLQPRQTIKNQTLSIIVERSRPSKMMSTVIEFWYRTLVRR